MKTTVKQLNRKQEANCFVSYGMFIEQVKSQRSILRVQSILVSLILVHCLLKDFAIQKTINLQQRQHVQWGIDHEDLA